MGKPHHLYYHVTTKTIHLLACRREGCPLGKEPRVLPKIPRSLSTMAFVCKSLVGSKKEKLEKVNEKAVIPTHLSLSKQ